MSQNIDIIIKNKLENNKKIKNLLNKTIIYTILYHLTKKNRTI